MKFSNVTIGRIEGTSNFVQIYIYFPVTSNKMMQSDWLIKCLRYRCHDTQNIMTPRRHDSLRFDQTRF